MEWFRWHHGTVDDAKFKMIARRSGQPKVVVISVWACILEFTSTRKDRGSLVGYDPEMTAATLDIDTEDVAAVVTAMQEKGLIDPSEVINWSKRQPEREDATAKDRKEEWKRRQAEKAEAERVGTQENAPGTHTERTGTQENAPVTPGTCIDLDLEKERETPKSKPFEDAIASLSPSPPGEPDGYPVLPSLTPHNSSRQHPVPITEIADLYHRLCPSLPRSQLPDSIKAHIRARYRNGMANLPAWEEYFALVNRCPHLIGQNDRGWTANLQWLVNPTNMDKVKGGAYLPKKGVSRRTSETIGAMQRFLERHEND